MQAIDGLWAAVKSVGLESDKFQLHFGDKALNIRAKGSDEPSVLLNRGALCGAMLQVRLAFHTYGFRVRKSGAYYRPPYQFRPPQIIFPCSKWEKERRNPFWQLVGSAAFFSPFPL